MSKKPTSGSLPVPFRWLWAGASASNLGDGMLLAAGPLLVLTMTREPLAVALAPFVQQVPWVLFGLLAGAVVDRVDRRALMIGVNLLRMVVMAALALVIFTGALTLPLLYAGLFLLGTAEAFADNAATSLIPTLVPKKQLGLANSRLFGTITITNQLSGPPLGAMLFAIGYALPYAGYALMLGVAVVLYSRVRIPLPEPTGDAVPETKSPSLVNEVREGLGWLRRHFAVRTLAILITCFNVTFGATFSMLVLYATGQLGLSDIGYGLLMSASAIGGILGALVFPALERRFSYTTLLRAGLILETVTHLALVLTHQAWLAMCILFLFGVHALVWGSVSSTVRQRAVPHRLMGRVNSVYMLGSVGGIALGSLLGGVLGQIFSYRAPFWFGFVGSFIILLLVWKPMKHIALAGADATEGT
ncbi:MFS transporter [Paeniglutamicibacter cryotolerans]|uniref:Putative MFS family arabinose efflux permease n=1 Tax=Paeniglutamicibacter cryotolerans TaxID=670079 RepID=A0A839QH89_9MICC|nr:MFS transporter [Paeniglutamicibacter cryotolerans]MBB2995107.1 putative MFS family arabinose efflux permease [Paeniglutamicibacter cryotolerans]